MEQQITAKLQQHKSRALGYRLLICYLKKNDNQLPERNARLWITKIFESSNSELRDHGDLIFTTLSLIILKIQSNGNLSKTFASSYLPKLFDMLHCNVIYERNTSIVSVLLTIKRCLTYYPKSIKTGIRSIEKFLISLLDNSNTDIVHQSGECWLLLKNIPGNLSSGNKSATLLRDYQLSLLKNLHYFINSEINNTQEIFDSNFIVHSFEHFTYDVNKHPFNGPQTVFQRIFNLIEFLKIILRKPLKSTKFICTQQILGLIKNGLNCKIQQRNNARIDKIYFETFLPEMHVKLLELLEILIEICNTHLRMDFRNVLNILMDAFETTKSVLEVGYTLRFRKLRSIVYRVVSVWCSTLKEGSHCEIISEAVIKEIMNDLMPCTQNFLLAPTKRDKQHLDEIFLMLDISIGNENDNMLRQQAYLCLQQLLSSSGHLIKTSILKESRSSFKLLFDYFKKYLLQDVHNTLLEISIQMYSNQMTKSYSSSIWNSRLKVYKLLMFLLKSRNLECPAPVEIIISLMGEFRLCDNSELSENAFFEALEQMIHSHKSDIYFKHHSTDVQYLNSVNDNMRLSKTEKRTLSKISSQRSCIQLLSNLEEYKEKRDQLSQSSSKYDIFDYYYNSKMDLMKTQEQDTNTKELDNNSSNISTSFENGSKLTATKENETVFKPLNNEEIFENNNLNNLEKTDISLTSGEKLGNDDIMIAELEATFVSELK
ncbi:hypothetical protein KR032_000357 [Drosophila birchii]|nr:hypothetical protein KR032_000357 [Drosophila birchii]